MATILPPPTRWDILPRPRSQPSSDGDQETYRPRSAKDTGQGHSSSRTAVISSIIDSFDSNALPTPKAVRPTTGNNQSRPRTADSGMRERRNLLRSVTEPASAMERHHHDHTRDEEAVYEARPPSSSSHHSTRRRSSLPATDGLRLRSFSKSSQKSADSVGSKDWSGNAKNKLSAESWVKGKGSSGDGDRSDQSQGSRVLRHKSSQENIRPPKQRVAPRPLNLDLSKLSRADQIIAKAATPTLASPKSRLFLNDTESNEEIAFPDTPPSPGKVADQPHEGEKSVAKNSSNEKVPTAAVEEDKTPVRGSAARNSIVDSIPLRTSSLRQSSVSPNPTKKKEKKSRKSKSSSRMDSVFKSSAKHIPDSKWADLGEDDETVKRIRQLRERRQSRLMESRSVSTPVQTSQQPAETRGSGPFLVVDPPRAGNDVRAPSPLRNAGISSSSNFSRKPPGSTKGLTTPGTEGSLPDMILRPYASLDERRPPNIRPSTGRSSHDLPSPALALDYSYAQAVDALQPPTTPQPNKAQYTQKSPSDFVGSGQQDTPSPSAARSPDAAASRSRSRSLKRTPNRFESRWIGVHPELPFGLDLKLNRRRSIGDNRPNRPNADSLNGVDVDTAPAQDSMEVAVDEYLQSPRFTRKVKHPLTARIITFSEVGDPNGAVVFVCVGMGLTRYIAGFFDELAYTLHLRLITIDRPGVGASQPYPPNDRRGPLGWPEDVLAICESLNITSFGVLAHSAGAIYALALAMILPEMITGRIHLLAPWIPPSQLEVYSHSSTSATPAGALPRSQRILRVLPTPFLKAANASFMSTASASLKPASRRSSGAAKTEFAHGLDLPTTDKRPASRDSRTIGHHRRESLLHMDQFMPDMGSDQFHMPAGEHNDIDESAVSSMRKGSLALAAGSLGNGGRTSHSTVAADYEESIRREKYSRRLTHKTWELATKDSNPAFDLLVCLERHRDIGFRYTDVRRNVVITHGSEDKRVPVGNVRWLAEQMNRRTAFAAGGGPDIGDPVDETSSPACELRILNGEGHGLMASPTVMGDVLTEIAEYWTLQPDGTMRENVNGCT